MTRAECEAMRVLVVLAMLCAVAHAEVGLMYEGGMGVGSSSGILGEPAEQRVFARRGALGYRRGPFGGEVMFLAVELGRDDTGFYDTLTVGAMFTARHKFLHDQMDGDFFSRWFEIYGRIGPAYTWVDGSFDTTGNLGGASGWGYAVGGGVRFVYCMIGLFADVTVLNTHVTSDADRDVQGNVKMPGADANGTVIAKTFGIGFIF